MSIRTLIWNIDNFDNDKIANPTTTGVEPGTTISPSAASAERLSYILDTFAISDSTTAPNIIAVIEVSSPLVSLILGQLAQSPALDASDKLLNYIRAKLGLHWALIPPLQMSPRNSIAVFYDTRSLVFSGPFVWPGGGSGVVAMRSGAAPPGDYPAAQQAGFGVADRKVPAGAQHNAGQLERQLAAATVFKYKDGHQQAGQEVDLPALRVPSPYMVTFAEIAGVQPAVQRNLSLFVVHGPNKDSRATQLLQKMASMQDIAGPFGTDEVRVVCGDFNLNVMDKALARSAGYTDFINEAKPGNLVYQLALDPVVPPPTVDLDGYKGYYATHMRPKDAAYFGTQKQGAASYPGYWYVGNGRRAFEDYALDNFLSVYGPGTTRPTSNITILNGVVGSPFGAQNPPFGGGPKGTLTRAIAMAGTDFQNPQPRNPMGSQNGFEQWGNFGRILSTSDHMAVVIDI